MRGDAGLIDETNTEITNSSIKAMQIFLELIKSGEECPLTGTGISMYPFLKDEKDIITMMPVKKNKIRVGDVLLYQRDDGIFVIHRLYKICKDETLWFVGDNLYYLEKNIRFSQLRAKAKYVTRNGETISCEHGFVRFFYTIRMKCRVVIHRIVHRLTFW